MKKHFSFFATCAAICMCMTGCNFIGNIVDTAEETSDIVKGKLFLVEEATVTYNDGTVLMFTDYGKNSRIVTDEEITISNAEEKTVYVLNVENKTYTVTEIPEDYNFSAAIEFVVTEKLLEAGEAVDKWASDVNIKKSSRVIAGKNCQVWSGDGEEIASWKRVKMYESTDGEVVFEAVRVSETASNLFDIPADYKKATEE